MSKSPRTVQLSPPWSPLDARAVDTARLLAADAVEAAGNGHPGTAMSLAPAAYVTYQRLLRHDPTDPAWPGRDRFVLSCGHSSLTQYIQLFLSGYGLTMEDLRHLRQWGSLTPGHPELHHTAGVETTTGPLGQGVATAVGMAMAGRRTRYLFDPEAAPGESVFDHTIYVFASDGDMEEGVAAEACSLAGTQQLGELVVLYDDNHISIEGDTDVAFTEDVLARYAAYGWHTQRVEDANDVKAIHAALIAARDHRDAPSIIAMRSIIAWPAPNAQNTGKSHGSALGPDEVAATKEALGFDPERHFHIEDDVLEHARCVVDRGRAAHAEWDTRYATWRAANADRAAELDRMRARRLPDGWASRLPDFPAGKAVATRVASGQVLNAVADLLPELWGGSADLAGSNNTWIDGAPSFLPASSTAKNADPAGRNIHFGVREHAMGAAMNGIALDGLHRPYGGTFLVFSDYMRGAVRLGALMKAPVVHVWTHDSIGLGEDGPTHQPVEHLWALRAIPGLDVIRPGDANETVIAWRTVIENPHGPAAMCLTRQNVPTFDRTSGEFAAADGVARGAYVLAEAGTALPAVILIGTGSELALAVQARTTLEAAGIGTRVVSMPCVEWFLAQDDAYRQAVLPPRVKARVSVEAGIAQGWWRFLGDGGEAVSLEHFGASAPFATLYEQFGITSAAVVAAAHRSLARTVGEKGSTTGN
ncbi:MAG: transketolase [Sporichthyaceae bacterium]